MLYNIILWFLNSLVAFKIIHVFNDLQKLVQKCIMGNLLGLGYNMNTIFRLLVKHFSFLLYVYRYLYIPAGSKWPMWIVYIWGGIYSEYNIN